MRVDCISVWMLFIWMVFMLMVLNSALYRGNSIGIGVSVQIRCSWRCDVIGLGEPFLSFATFPLFESLFVIIPLLFPHRRVEFTGILDRFECRLTIYIIGWIAIFTHFGINCNDRSRWRMLGC